MARRTTIKEIAAHASVSIGTVSNVLNNKANVDPGLQERVRKAIDELDYRVNVHARGMILRRSYNIGVVIPSLIDPFFPQFADNLERTIEDQGSHVIIASSRHDAERERQVCDSLVSKQIDGLIVSPCSRENIDYFNDLVSSDLPVVQLGRYYEEIEAPIVMADNYDAGNKVVDYLCSQGHERILHLAGSTESNPDKERRNGFVSAVDRLGLKNHWVCDATSKAWREDVLSILSGTPEHGSPTAVFADDDLYALSFLRLCRSRGIRIPQDLSLVSIGVASEYELLMPMPTRFTVDPVQMSAAAAQNLFYQINSDAEHPDGSVAESMVTISLSFSQGETVQQLVEASRSGSGRDNN